MMSTRCDIEPPRSYWPLTPRRYPARTRQQTPPSANGHDGRDQGFNREPWPAVTGAAAPLDDEGSDRPGAGRARRQLPRDSATRRIQYRYQLGPYGT